MAKSWNGKIQIRRAAVEVDVTIIEPTEFELGEWYGTGTFISGDYTDFFNSMGIEIDTHIGKIIYKIDDESHISFVGNGVFLGDATTSS